MPKIRASVAAIGAVSILLGGFWALNQQAQTTESEIDSQAANQTWQFGVNIYDGLGQATGISLAWGGFFAVLAIALGILYLMSVGGGGR